MWHERLQHHKQHISQSCTRMYAEADSRCESASQVTQVAGGVWKGLLHCYCFVSPVPVTIALRGQYKSSMLHVLVKSGRER